jgi:hypothetical protein
VNAPAHHWKRFARDALVSGSVASVASTLVIAACSRIDARHAAAGTNATSHWLWGRAARRRQAPSGRYTLVGYAIHHASSLWWGAIHVLLLEAARRRAVAADDRVRCAGLAAAISAIAYGVDYHVVPRRLTPGFESHLRPRSMAAVYAAFGVGLALSSLALRGRGRAAAAGGTAFRMAAHSAAAAIPAPPPPRPRRH